MNDDNLIIADPWGQDSWGSSAIVGTNSNSYTIANTSSAPTQTIQGKMLRVGSRFPRYKLESMNKEAIKREMIHDLIEELIRSESVEFTYLQEPSADTIQITARIFVTPDDQVRLLRKAGY